MFVEEIKMLKGIPKILSPELLKVLCEMGHSDRIVIADGNFPSESMGKDAIVIRMICLVEIQHYFIIHLINMIS